MMSVFTVFLVVIAATSYIMAVGSTFSCLDFLDAQYIRVATIIPNRMETTNVMKTDIPTAVTIEAIEYIEHVLLADEHYNLEGGL